MALYRPYSGPGPITRGVGGMVGEYQQGQQLRRDDERTILEQAMRQQQMDVAAEIQRQKIAEQIANRQRMAKQQQIANLAAAMNRPDITEESYGQLAQQMQQLGGPVPQKDFPAIRQERDVKQQYMKAQTQSMTGKDDYKKMSQINKLRLAKAKLQSGQSDDDLLNQIAGVDPVMKAMLAGKDNTVVINELDRQIAELEGGIIKMPPFKKVISDVELEARYPNLKNMSPEKRKAFIELLKKREGK